MEGRELLGCSRPEDPCSHYCRIAGCLSAAVLSKHFEKVVIVEAEELPMLKSQVSGGTPENVRRRVPQYLQVRIPEAEGVVRRC